MSKGHYRELQLVQQYGDLERVIPQLLKECDGSQKEVAMRLQVTQAFISRWLHRKGYKRIVKWVKADAVSDDTQLISA